MGQRLGINLREVVQRSNGVGIVPVDRVHVIFLLGSLTGAVAFFECNID
jgi:hypothetical protein